MGRDDNDFEPLAYYINLPHHDPYHTSICVHDMWKRSVVFRSKQLRRRGWRTSRPVPPPPPTSRDEERMETEEADPARWERMRRCSPRAKKGTFPPPTNHQPTQPMEEDLVVQPRPLLR